MSLINQRSAHTKSFLCTERLAIGTFVKIVAAISGANGLIGGIAVISGATDIAAAVVQTVVKDTKTDGTVLYRITVGLLGEVWRGIASKALSIGDTLTHEGTSVSTIPEGVGSSLELIKGTRLTDFTISATGTSQKQFLGIAISTAAAENEEIEVLTPLGFYARV